MNDYKDKLLATVSHDLKTPLSAIISLIESCMTQIEQEDIKKILQDTLKLSDLLTHLIHDIQDYGQIDNCSLKLNIIKFNLKDCISEILDIFEVKKRKGIDLILDCNPKVENQNSDSSQIYEINSDSQRLKQILLNLIGNAIKFTIKGFIKIYFEIKPDSDTVEVIITDTGIGMNEDIQKKLFKEYNTFDTTSVRKSFQYIINTIFIQKFFYQQILQSYPLFKRIFFENQILDQLEKNNYQENIYFKVYFKGIYHSTLLNIYDDIYQRLGLNQHGVGLGLYMCKKLAGILGPEDSIKLISKEGQGSSFSFIIYRNLQEKLKENVKNQFHHNQILLNGIVSDEKDAFQLIDQEESLDEYQNQQISSMICDFNQYNFQQIFQKSKFSMSSINKYPTIDNYQNSIVDNNSGSQKYLKNIKSFQPPSANSINNKLNMFSSSELRVFKSFSPNQYTSQDKNNYVEGDQFINISLPSVNKNLNQSLSTDNSRLNLLGLGQQKNQGNSLQKSYNPIMNLSMLQFSPQHHSQNKLKTKNHILNLDRDIENSFLESQNGLTITKTPEQSIIHGFQKEQVYNEFFKDRLFGGLEVIQSQRSYSPSIYQEIQSTQKNIKIGKITNNNEDSDVNKQQKQTFEQKLNITNNNNLSVSRNIAGLESSIYALQTLKDLKQSKLDVSDVSYVHTNEQSNQLLNYLFSKQTNILVVDDEEIGHRVFQHQFKQFSSVKLESAYNGQEAIDKIMELQKQIDDKISKDNRQFSVNNQDHELIIENKFESNDLSSIPDEKRHSHQEKNVNNEIKSNLNKVEIQYNLNNFQDLSNQQAIQQYNFIFMDYCMPVMNGVQAVQKIRELQRQNIINSSIYIYMVSGYDQSQDTIEFIQKGADGIISKPVSQMKIAQALIKVMDNQ